jgi:hypothetical protein
MCEHHTSCRCCSLDRPQSTCQELLARVLYKTLALKGGVPMQTAAHQSCLHCLEDVRMPSQVQQPRMMVHVMQTARRLFRMSLFHLPLFLLLLALHRVPNTDDKSWSWLQSRLHGTTEAAEKQVSEHVHGGNVCDAANAPAALKEQMLFPFSPPLMLPCPYHSLKYGAGAATVAPAAAASEASVRPALVSNLQERGTCNKAKSNSLATDASSEPP